MQLNQSQIIKQSQTQTQKLKQILSPKTIQMLKIFNTSYVDLVEKIKSESADNVLIEIQEPDRLEHYEMSLRKQKDETLNQQDISDFAKDNRDKNLHEFLRSQLNLISISEDKKRLMEHLIDAIDSRGYIPNFKSISTDLCNRFSVQSRTVLDALKTIQTFEPDGVGARTLKECLLIQLDHYSFDSQDLKDIIEFVIKRHIDELTPEHYDNIALSANIGVDGVASIHDFIKNNFNPSPGSSFATDNFDYSIIPSFEVSIDEENQVCIKNLEQRLGIQINISSQYLKLLADPNTDSETKTFLSEKLQRAKDLESHLNNRTQTMEKVAHYLFNKQHLFLKNGFDYLIPLLQKQVAADLAMNPSTVSRIFSSKYCRTPYGIFSLNQLCPRNHFGKTATQLKQIIHALIEENPTLSDQKLSLLLTQKGIPMKRRTVTKYRHELGIESRLKRRLSNQK